jgi:hypothetical protein
MPKRSILKNGLLVSGKLSWSIQKCKSESNLGLRLNKARADYVPSSSKYIDKNDYMLIGWKKLTYIDVFKRLKFGKIMLFYWFLLSFFLLTCGWSHLFSGFSSCCAFTLPHHLLFIHFLRIIYINIRPLFLCNYSLLFLIVVEYDT